MLVLVDVLVGSLGLSCAVRAGGGAPPFCARGSENRAQYPVLDVTTSLTQTDAIARRCALSRSILAVLRSPMAQRVRRFPVLRFVWSLVDWRGEETKLVRPRSLMESTSSTASLLARASVRSDAYLADDHKEERAITAAAAIATAGSRKPPSPRHSTTCWDIFRICLFYAGVSLDLSVAAHFVQAGSRKLALVAAGGIVLQYFAAWFGVLQWLRTQFGLGCSWKRDNHNGCTLIYLLLGFPVGPIALDALLLVERLPSPSTSHQASLLAECVPRTEPRPCHSPP